MHSEMHSVWQNPIQRTVRTAHLSVLMIVHNCRIHTTQNSSDNLPSYLQTNTIAQMLSIRERGPCDQNYSFIYTESVHTKESFLASCCLSFKYMQQCNNLMKCLSRHQSNINYAVSAFAFYDIRSLLLCNEFFILIVQTFWLLHKKLTLKMYQK